MANLTKIHLGLLLCGILFVPLGCGSCSNPTSAEDIPGCTDPAALNYNPEATIDDGSCEYNSVPPPEEYFAFNQSLQQAFYFIGDALINDVALDTLDWIAAFKGDICVGAKHWAGPYTDLPVFGDDGTPETEGYMLPTEVPMYKIYDASQNAYYDAVASEDHPWYNNDIVNVALLWVITGCTDVNAENYDPDATSDDGSCTYSQGPHYQVTIELTGESHLVVIQTSVTSLQIGDEIGLYDALGITNSGDCSSVLDEVLVASCEWTGAQLNLSAIGSVDNCGLGGIQLPGYVEGNAILLKVWRSEAHTEFSAAFTLDSGLSTWGGQVPLTVISEITLNR